MKKVSIIIPIYNTAPYLRRCLDSAKNQTYPNIEIICVDDGSTDGSEKILDEYACDERFVIIHKCNGGESSARNVGLLKSTGDYIGFMDCDDWIDTDMYAILVNAMEEYDVDMAAASWFKSYDTEEKEMTNLKPLKEGVLDREQLLRYIYERDAYQGFAYMWDKLYKREILTNTNGDIILFDENIRLGGDVIYLAKAALNCKNATYIPRGMYHYYQRNMSGCHTDNLEKRLDWIKSYLIVIDMFEKENVSEEVLNYVKRFMAYHSCNVAELAYEQNDSKVHEYCQNIMRQYEDVYISLNESYPERVKRYRNVLQLKKGENYAAKIENSFLCSN